MVSLGGLIAGIAAGALFALGRPVGAGLVIILCGLLDVLDGTIAVETRRQSQFGAILDSSLDRYSEFFIYAGLAYHFRAHWAMALAGAAFMGSMMVSYSRARAEGLGVSSRVGIMQRAERLALLCLGGLIGTALRVPDQALIVVLGLIALLANVTAWQRILAVRTSERRKAGTKSKSNQTGNRAKP